MQRRKKIILFDSWTKGSRHIFRLLDILESKSIEIILVHIGSWGDELGRPVRETISGLEVRDIKYYKGVTDIIYKENPDLVFFLSLDVLPHRMFNRYCKYFKIPTVNLYHGVHSVFETLDSDKKQILNYWSVLFSRIKNLLRYSLFEYVVCLFKTKANVRIWYELAIDILRKFLGKAIEVARDDSKTDFICVFNKFDQQHALTKYSIEKERIIVVGNPDLLKFSGLKDSINRYKGTETLDNKNVLYIGTGVRSTKMLVADDKDYYIHLLDTQKALESIGKKLCLKLHYSRNEKLKNYFHKEKNLIDFCSDENFISFLQDASFAIVEPSTASLVPAFMGKPIILCQYGKLQGLDFGEAISSYPFAFSIKNLDNIKEIITMIKAKSTEQNKKSNWIKYSTHPLPVEDMPMRVVKVFEKAIESKYA